MELIPVNCNHCGAPLRVAEGTRFVTCQHCGSQLEVHRNATAVYTEALQLLDQNTRQIATDVHVLRRQAELEALDREWEMERASLVVRNQDGTTSVPSAGQGIAGGVFAIGMGCFWIVFTSAMMHAGPGAPGVFGIFPLFGLLIIGAGVVSIFTTSGKAKQYAEAEERYRARRAELSAERDGPPAVARPR